MTGLRFLIDLTHPAHVHFFRAAIDRLRNGGHDVALTAREKGCLVPLARELDLRVESFGGAPSGLLGMTRTLLGRQARLLRILRRFRPHATAAIAGTFVAPPSRALGIPCAVFTDTESARLSNAIAFPCASRVITPEAYTAWAPRQVRYAGCHELAYLHPDVFTPDPAVRTELGLAHGERYAIVRFVGWGAAHDLGRDRASLVFKHSLVERLRKHLRVFISSEGPLPAALEPLRYPLPAHRMHHALAFATLLAGESSTMASEAAVLGVPSLFVYPRVELGIIREQADRWKLLHWFSVDECEAALETAERIVREADEARWRALGRAFVDASVQPADVICEQLLELAA